MVINVKQQIEIRKPPSKSRWHDLWAALETCPVGGGIQEPWDVFNIKSKIETQSLRTSLHRKFGSDMFSISQSGGMITIIRLKEAK